MFNALNRFISRLDGDPQHQRQREREQYGFQVLRNTNLELAIEPWFDFIVGINGRMIVCCVSILSVPPTHSKRDCSLPNANICTKQDNPDARLFAQEVRNCAGGTVALGIWSAKVRTALFPFRPSLFAPPFSLPTPQSRQAGKQASKRPSTRTSRKGSRRK